MVTKEEFSGKYHQVKGRIKEKYGSLTDDDFERGSGGLEQLVGIIQQKTGETRRTIEQYLNNLFENAEGMAGQVATKVRDYASQAGDSIRGGYDQMASNMREGYEQAEAVVRRNPRESVAAALGIGFLVGAVLGLMISKSR